MAQEMEMHTRHVAVGLSGVTSGSLAAGAAKAPEFTRDQIV